MGLLILLSAFYFYVGSLHGSTIPSNLTANLFDRSELSGLPGAAAMPTPVRWPDRQAQAPVREGPPSRKDQKKLDQMPAIAEEEEQRPGQGSRKSTQNQSPPTGRQQQLPTNKNSPNEQKPVMPVKVNDNTAPPKSTNRNSGTDNSSNQNSNNSVSTTEGLPSPANSHSGNDVSTGFFLFMLALILVGLLALLLIGKRIYGLISKR